MARATKLCAPVWSLVPALAVTFHGIVVELALGQAPVAAPQPTVPAAQPTWVAQAPMFQVGPDGAVNLDQPIMMPAMPGMPGTPYGGAPMVMPYAASPMYCGPSGYYGQPCATQPCPTPTVMTAPTPIAPPPPALKLSVFGDVLWIHPTGIDMAHAQQQNGIGGPGTTPFGEIGVADPSYDLGFRIGGELRVAADAGVFVAYSFFESESASTVEVGDGGNVGSLVHHPGAELTASDGPVDANYEIKYQLGDVAYRQILWRTNVQYVSVFGGGRFASLEQDFLQTGIFGIAPGAIDTSTTIEFTGAGPLAGIDSARQIGATRFSFYGRSLVAALTGEFDNRYRMFNMTTTALLAESLWKDDRIVPMLDYEIGIAWTSPQGKLRLAAGYMGSHWFNVVSTPVWVDAVQADNYVNVDDTVSFDGLVGRVEWVF